MIIFNTIWIYLRYIQKSSVKTSNNSKKLIKLIPTNKLNDPPIFDIKSKNSSFGC